MACIFRPHVTLSFVRLSRNTYNSDLLRIRRNSTMYLDFVRRTQRYVQRRHTRSREIPRFATRVYHFTFIRGLTVISCPYHVTYTIKAIWTILLMPITHAAWTIISISIKFLNDHTFHINIFAHKYININKSSPIKQWHTLSSMPNCDITCPQIAYKQAM